MSDPNERLRELTEDDWARITALFTDGHGYRGTDGDGMGFVVAVKHYLEQNYGNPPGGEDHPHRIHTEHAGVVALGAISAYRRFVEESESRTSPSANNYKLIK